MPIAYQQPEAKAPLAVSTTPGSRYIVHLEGGEQKVSSVKILFATYHKVVRGTLDIVLNIGADTFKYRMDMSHIKDNEGVQLDLDRYASGSSVEVILRAEYTGGDILAIWMGDTGPCFTVATLGPDRAPVYNGPKISVLIPCFNTPVDFLRDAVESVLRQTYRDWELILVDDMSDSREIRELIHSYSSRYPEIVKAVYRESNGGISAALNSAMEVATGAWVTVLDHDDTIEEVALEEVARAIFSNLDASIIYTDEDKILSWGTAGTVYGDAFHKPDWSPTLFRGQMYICHLTVFKNTKQSWDSAFDGSQDYEYALRYLRNNEGCKVIHIPKVLYHWRSHSGSTASSMAVKPESSRAAINALQVDARVSGAPCATVSSSPYRGAYWTNNNFDFLGRVKVSVIIPNKDSYALLKNCLESLESSSWPGVLEIIIVDNGSTDQKTLDYYEHLKAAFIFRSDRSFRVIIDPLPFNFSKMVNRGVAASTSDYVLLLNNDTEVITHDWLQRMMDLLLEKGVGVVGAQLLYQNGTIQHAGVCIGLGGVAGHNDLGQHYSAPGYFSRLQLAREVECVTGACQLIRKSVFEEVMGYEELLPEAFNDVDFCLKVRMAGYRVLYTPHAKLFHFESMTRGPDTGKPSFMNAVTFMMRRWKTNVYEDRYTRRLTCL